MSIELTSTAKKHLRTLGRPLPAIVQIGKAGLTEPLQRQVAMTLIHRELIKVKTLDTCGETIDEVVAKLTADTDAAVVAVVGRTALLYRPNPDLPASKRIKLPT